MEALIAHFTHPKVHQLKHPLSKPRVVCFEGTIISYAHYLNELAAYKKRAVLTHRNLGKIWAKQRALKNKKNAAIREMSND